jgi:hypothetical protein
MTNPQPTRADKTSKVEGPIRCHKCQLMCRDAEHYLSHLSRKCEREPSSRFLAFR